jgi:hypothetical protein
MNPLYDYLIQNVAPLIASAKEKAAAAIEPDIPALLKSSEQGSSLYNTIAQLGGPNALLSVLPNLLASGVGYRMNPSGGNVPAGGISQDNTAQTPVKTSENQSSVPLPPLKHTTPDQTESSSDNPYSMLFEMEQDIQKESRDPVTQANARAQALPFLHKAGMDPLVAGLWAARGMEGFVPLLESETKVRQSESSAQAQQMNKLMEILGARETRADQSTRDAWEAAVLPLIKNNEPVRVPVAGGGSEVVSPKSGGFMGMGQKYDLGNIMRILQSMSAQGPVVLPPPTGVRDMTKTFDPNRAAAIRQRN